MERNVPKLRFKGFSDEWEERKLGDLCIVNGRIGFRGYTTDDIVSKSEGVISLSPSNIVNSKLFLDRDNTYISLDKYYESPEIMIYNDDILFVKTGSSLGKVALVENLDEKATINPQLIVLKNIKISPKILSELIDMPRVKNQIQKSKGGGTIPTLTQKEFSEYSVLIPKQNLEQEKIANFLTKVDKIIEKQDEKVKNLEKYKKGIMQRIFSQEIRFKDENGEEYPEWEYKRFGDITKKTGERNKENKEYKVYSISNKYGFIPQEEQFEESRLDSLDKSAYKIVYAGDFAYNPARINVGSIGLLDSGEGIVSSLYVCFRLTEEMNNEFYKNYFSTFTFNKDVIRSVEGGVREYLFYDNFIRIKAPVPCFREQNKIAEFLDIISKTLNKEAEKLNELKKWKKGLLQQMFV